MAGFVRRESVRNLLKECCKMYNLDHPHVLKLVGVCMDGGPSPYIVMPFMANGCLIGYLQKERANLLLSPQSTKPEDAVSSSITEIVYYYLLNRKSLLSVTVDSLKSGYLV